jgi:hypothetical protein
MFKELKQMDDEALLQEYSKNPSSNRGLSAHAELQYRQFETTKKNNELLARYNKLVMLFTVALVICGALQAVSNTIQSYVAWKAFSSDSREMISIRSKIAELEERMRRQDEQK